MSDVTYTPTASEVKALRETTQAGMMDCKRALEETGGDIDAAVKLLREKGIASADKRAGRGTGEGAVETYVHAGGRIGAMVEVGCETDFVARNEQFQEFAARSRCRSPPAATLRFVSRGRDPRRLQGGRARDLPRQGRRRGQARGDAGQDRRRHVEEVADRARAAEPAVDPARGRRQDDRDAARRARRARSARTSRSSASPASRWAPSERARLPPAPAEALRRGADGRSRATARTPIGSAPSPARVHDVREMGVAGRHRGRRRQHPARHAGGRPRHGPRHRRLRRHAGDAAERADGPGRAGEAGRPHAGDVGDRRGARWPSRTSAGARSAISRRAAS